MAGSFSDFLELEILDHIFNTAYTRPTDVYFALFTAAPTDSGGGTEVTGGSYARVAKTTNTTNFPAASAGAISNGTAVTFPTATGSWGTVVAMALFDAASAGNMLMWADLAANKTVGSGDSASFAIGDFDVTLT